MRVIEQPAKSIMVASKLPDADYVLNPYTGCAFGCSYCYATFMGKYYGEEIEDWGDYVYVKTNAVELARQEVARMGAAKRQSTLLLSSVTDPYQGLEAKYRLTRGILEVLADADWPGRVGILTKSPLVTRDIDVLKRLRSPEVGLTVTTTDDEISSWLEMRAPKASARIKALHKLTDAGLPVYAFVGPLLPHFRESPELLDRLFADLAGAGVREVYIEHINLKAYIRSRLEPRLASESTSVQESYVMARKDEHRAALGVLVAELLEKYGLRMRLDEVLYHPEGVAAAAVTRDDKTDERT
ncbi:MAG: radical SAM protein [Actinomycetota bacterium]|nr:radical SAM protein [Actinomycetota bacterium]